MIQSLLSLLVTSWMKACLGLFRGPKESAARTGDRLGLSVSQIEETRRYAVPALLAVTMAAMFRAFEALLVAPWVSWTWSLVDDYFLVLWFSACAVLLIRKRQQFAAVCALLAASYTDAPIRAAGFDPTWFSVQSLFVPVLWVIAIEQPTPIPLGPFRKLCESMCIGSFAVAFVQLSGLSELLDYWMVLGCLGLPALALLAYRVKTHRGPFSVEDAYITIGLAPIGMGMLVHFVSLVIFGSSPVAGAWLYILLANISLSLVPVGALVESYGVSSNE